MSDGTILALAFMGGLGAVVVGGFGLLAWMLWLEHKRAIKGDA